MISHIFQNVNTFFEKCIIFWKKSEQFGNIFRDAFQPDQVFLPETGEKRTVEIEHSQKRTVLNDRNDDFGVGRAVAGDMPRERMHVFDELRFTFSPCRSAYPFPLLNATAGYLSLKRSEDELPVLMQIKSRPVEPVDFGEKQSGEICKIADQVAFSLGDRLCLLE